VLVTVALLGTWWRS